MAINEKDIENKSEEVDTEGKEMNFFDHIGELRKRIIYSLIFIILGAVLAGIFINDIMDYILLNPAKQVNLNLQNLRPFGQPFLYFKVIFVVGLIIAFPMILFQLWKFIKPGLYFKEIKWVRYITLFTTLCFFVGVAFSYFLMIPSMLNFAAQFGSDKIQNNIDINEYFSFITMMLLASGILFEMPMVTFVLSKVGIITPTFMRKYRRHSIVVILILAAVLTPTPDPISQLIFAAPLFILYEISILISKIAEKKYNDND
ncbi:MAG TPA: twin-arginine translocase subunit TatC [Candidatus Kapabacteria bacterium]|mgnify:CR=1 FL=1|nr:twin-arginine translocase subunit TatC [Candidatus Kapabacteria bacterium]HPO63043.1 twin-arginine translocase subunit TatC [Candidatus Kapabacteria bacterium]